jgi:hypothetical protein
MSLTTWRHECTKQMSRDGGSSETGRENRRSWEVETGWPHIAGPGQAKAAPALTPGSWCVSIASPSLSAAANPASVQRQAPPGLLVGPATRQGKGDRNKDEDGDGHCCLSLTHYYSCTTSHPCCRPPRRDPGQNIAHVEPRRMDVRPN